MIYIPTDDRITLNGLKDKMKCKIFLNPLRHKIGMKSIIFWYKRRFPFHRQFSLIPEASRKSSKITKSFRENF